MRVGDRTYDCQSGRGAGGQFILILPELELIIVVTAHHQGMGKMLSAVPQKILPVFSRSRKRALATSNECFSKKAYGQSVGIRDPLPLPGKMARRMLSFNGFVFYS